MLIKTGSLGRAGDRPHRIKRSLGGGVYEIEHPPDCLCQILWSVEPCPWISYNIAYGRLFCDHCKTEESLPCPARKDHLLSRTVWMEPEALESDLKRFQLAHESCILKPKDGTDPPR